ncbi:MAG: Glutathione transporter ATP-binding protein [Firmicutes bacterium]|nr:Glutathione transporter ATP-binding protein [Bacillota bacterium]
MLDIRNLNIRFYKNREGRCAVQNLNLHMEPAEILGLVGESGSGKTVTAMAISGLMSRSQAECRRGVSGAYVRHEPRDEDRRSD